MGAAEFYDSLAATYHALYPDWEQQLDDQAAALLAHLPCGRRLRIADVACGIGTQLLGLARAGHEVVGSDISAAAVERARAELAARQLSATLEVADMRALPWPDASMDAVICADNALPHLLEDGQVSQALREMRRVLVPAGTVIVSTRDYDGVLTRRPASTPAQLATAPDGSRFVTFQLWHWRAGSDVYDLEHFQLIEDDSGWRTTVRAVSYRAYTRRHLSDLARQAGLVDPAWLTGEATRFFQPLLIARRPDLPR